MVPLISKVCGSCNDEIGDGLLYSCDTCSALCCGCAHAHKRQKIYKNHVLFIRWSSELETSMGPWCDPSPVKLPYMEPSVIRGMVIGSSDWRVSYSRQSLVFVDVLFMIIILCALVHFRTSGLKSRISTWTWTWQVQVQVGILDLNSRNSAAGFGIPEE